MQIFWHDHIFVSIAYTKSFEFKLTIKLQLTFKNQRSFLMFQKLVRRCSDLCIVRHQVMRNILKLFPQATCMKSRAVDKFHEFQTLFAILNKCKTNRLYGLFHVFIEMYSYFMGKDSNYTQLHESFYFFQFSLFLNHFSIQSKNIQRFSPLFAVSLLQGSRQRADLP